MGRRDRRSVLSDAARSVRRAPAGAGPKCRQVPSAKVGDGEDNRSRADAGSRVSLAHSAEVPSRSALPTGRSAASAPPVPATASSCSATRSSRRRWPGAPGSSRAAPIALSSKSTSPKARAGPPRPSPSSPTSCLSPSTDRRATASRCAICSRSPSPSSMRPTSSAAAGISSRCGPM